MTRLTRWLTCLLGAALLGGPARADPCGMVPPLYTGPGIPITRVGPQRTYVFFKDGMETYVIRPGFSGNVDDFGMLIPFPSPPGLRKVPDELFAQIAAAVDPPEVLVDLNPPPPMSMIEDRMSAASGAANEKGLAFDEVKVLHQEAIGMYEVAVLAAGSASALQRWMDEHGFRYPKGMDAVVNDYVRQGWVWVAERTRVGDKPKTDPRPGMRSVTSRLPPGATFDGYVQAMGFRFKVERPVVPMRLSPFNAGEKRQIVYYLTDRAVRLEGVPEELVRRQVSGPKLLHNLTNLLPLRVIGGTLPADQIPVYRDQRNPAPHNGEAKDLFASDLLAVRTGQLNLASEEKEKELLNIGEALGLRGPEIDTLHEAEVASERDHSALQALDALKGLTMTVVDGEIAEDYLKEHDLTIAPYEMPRKANSPMAYDCKVDGPTGDQGGYVIEGEKDVSWFKRIWK